MEQIKHKTLPFKETVQIKDIIGTKVLTEDGKSIGKVKSIHIHPNDLTIEGVQVDPGWFDIDQYIDTNYIKSMTKDAVILKINPVTELIGHKLFDSIGKQIGIVTKVNRSRMTNNLLSVSVRSEDVDEEITIGIDYIATLGEGIMLKEPFNIKNNLEK